METPSNVTMFRLELPNDAKLLEAVGVVALRHAHLDYVLRMMINSR